MNLEILVFEVGGSRLSIPLELVEEVVPSGIVTGIPNSPPFLLGLAAVRGKILGVIDAARRFGIGPAPNSHFLICRVRGNLTAIAIDRPIVAGAVPVRPLEESSYAVLRKKFGIQDKFLKAGYELLELKEEGAEPTSTGIHFIEVEADLFVSAEMASKVGEA